MSQNVEFETQQNNPFIPEVQDILPDDVIRFKDQILLVDVRPSGEFHGELGHIKGSEMVVLNELPEKINTLPKDKPIVFICRSGNRSAQACHFASSKGYTNTYNLKGGMILWNNSGLEVEK